MKDKRKIRYGVVGLGYIAQTAVLPAFGHAKSNSVLTALISEDSAKLKKLGKRHNVDHCFKFDELEVCLASGYIDALYIATPNTKHDRILALAAKHKVHVLCEKPMAMDEKTCKKMIEDASSNRIKLMVGYRLHFDPANLFAIEIAQSKKIGDLKYFNSIFSMQVRDRKNIRLRSDGGGPLYDIGIYCINGIRNLFQAEPISVFASSLRSNDPRFINVEETVSVIMKFPKDRMATFTVSFGSGDAATMDLVGTKGRIHVENCYDYALPMEVQIFKNEKRKKKKFKRHDQFAAELIYFSECILKDKSPEPSGMEGLADVRILEALTQSLRTEKIIGINQIAKKLKWPTSKQKIQRPPLKAKPMVFHAKEPSVR